jgi:hypothetical protein
MNLSFWNVDQLCSHIDCRESKPIIDLSAVTFFRPFSLVYLGMFLRYHNYQGQAFKIVVPSDIAARSYLARQKFWERFNFNAKSVQSESLIRFTTSTSLNAIVDIERKPHVAEDIAARVCEVLRKNHVRVKASLVAELVCELVDNFAIHSEETLAAVAMQYYPNLHRVILAVGDRGVGIRSSLSSNPTFAYLSSARHYEAALKAFEPLVSRIPGCGTGLTEVRDGAVDLGGRLVLSTGDGYVIIGQDGTKYGKMYYDLPGVQVELSIPEEV